MKSEDVHKLLGKNTDTLTAIGYKKRSSNSFENKNTALSVYLGKWGWTEEAGWDFSVQLTDKNSGVTTGNVTNLMVWDNLTPDYLVGKKLATWDEIHELYDQLPDVKDRIIDRMKTLGVYGFYDEGNLAKVLAYVMPRVAKAAEEWSAVQLSDQTRKPQQPQERSKEERDQMEKEFRDAMK